MHATRRWPVYQIAYVCLLFLHYNKYFAWNPRKVDIFVGELTLETRQFDAQVIVAGRLNSALSCPAATTEKGTPFKVSGGFT